MKPLAVFAMPKDRNKLLNPRVADSRARKPGQKVNKGTKKRAPKSPGCHESDKGNHRLPANSG